MPRTFHLGLLVPTVALGLWSRSAGAAAFSPFVAEYAGDVLWGLMVFLLLGVAAGPRLSPLTRGALALLVAFAVEFSQLYHTPWIDNLRATRLGALVLGHGFLWSDLVCYTVGVVLGLGVEGIARSLAHRTPHKEHGDRLPE